MKKALTFLSILCLAFASCSEEETETIKFTRDNLSVSDKTLIIESAATSATLTVTANCQWTAELGNDKWDGLTINQSSNSIQIATPVNDKPTVRTATLTVRSQSGDVTRTVTIQQNESDVTMSVSTTSIPLPANTTDTGSNVTFTVTSNSSWNITGGADWFTYTPSEGNGGAAETVTVTLVKDNTKEENNTATLTVTSGTQTKTITVTQAAKTVELILPQKTFEVSATNGSCQVELLSNNSWYAQKDQSWITLDVTSGEGNATVSVTCTPNTSTNTREATIIFLAGSKQEQITIRQGSSSAPTLTELVVSNVSKTQATVDCSFTSLFDVEEYGICYSATNPEPTADNNPVKHTNGGKSGDIHELITGLASGQTYYIRAYARSQSGIGYSNVQQITTAGRKPGQDDNGEPNL